VRPVPKIWRLRSPHRRLSRTKSSFWYCLCTVHVWRICFPLYPVIMPTEKSTDTKGRLKREAHFAKQPSILSSTSTAKFVPSTQPFPFSVRRRWILQAIRRRRFCITPCIVKRGICSWELVAWTLAYCAIRPIWCDPCLWQRYVFFLFVCLFFFNLTDSL